MLVLGAISVNWLIFPTDVAGILLKGKDMKTMDCILSSLHSNSVLYSSTKSSVLAFHYYGKMLACGSLRIPPCRLRCLSGCCCWGRFRRCDPAGGRVLREMGSEVSEVTYHFQFALSAWCLWVKLPASALMFLLRHRGLLTLWNRKPK